MDRRVVDLLFWAINKGKKKTSAYDTTAIVKRVEGNTAYVHIPGGVDETPVRLTVSAQAGDLVQVRVSGGRAWVTGNSTAPPTDDTKAKEAIKSVNIVQKSVAIVKETVERVGRIAGNTAQYFWFTETGTDTGAHITEIPKDNFLADPEHGGGNFLARSNGVAVRDGLEELATFGADGAQVGKSDDSNVQIAPDSIKMFKGQLECVSFSLPTEEETRIASNSQLVFGDRTFSAGELVVTLNNISGFDNTRHFIDCLGLGRYELTLTTQGGYDQADPSTYYYVQQLANGNWAFYSNANRTTQVIEALTTEFYKNIYTAPAYVGCYAKKSNIYRPIMFAVGNGEPDDPSNALEVDWFGNLTCGSIDSGKYEGSNISAGSYDDFTISFNHEFSAAPIVTVSFKANTPSSVASMGNVSMTVYDVSTTGFKVRVYNNSSAGRLPHINWIAILS